MPRKHKDTVCDEQEIGDLLHEVFRLTTQEDRREIVLRWCRDYQVDARYTAHREIAPVYFVLGALIDGEHPLIMSERGRMFSFVACVQLIIAAEIRQSPQPFPLYTGDVYRVCTPVDNSAVVHRGED